MPAHDLGALIHQELSGERAQSLTAALTQFHRPPGSSGYHTATNLVIDRLKDSGIDEIDITTYPLDGKTEEGGGDRFPLAWEPTRAVVSIINPISEEVVNMETTTSCLAWWSMPAPPGGMTAELVDVGTGESEADFEGKDLTGKIVLIGHTERRDGFSYAARQVMERGAKGILSDYLFFEFQPERTRENLPEAVQLLRLPNQLGEFDAWACSISYPVAQRLRELLRLGPVTLHADIQCRSFAGHGRNVLATIPGREHPEESVFFIAHTSAATCPCANCAAGPSLMVEIARTLKTLINRGEIQPPRRSIKFLFLIEGHGSRAFIIENRAELSRVKTAFCFDSVGNDQEKTKSSLLFYRHPDSSPSFINDYFASVMEQAPDDRTWVFANRTDLSAVQFLQAPYTDWSDNRVWTAYGVPTPLIMSWPDLYFHTQLLTADKTDPRVFRRAGVTSALAAYRIADASEEDALIIADEVAARSELRLKSLANQAMQRILSAQQARDERRNPARITARARKQLAYFAERDAAAVASVQTLIPGEPPDELLTRIEEHGAALREQAGRLANRLDASLERLQREGVR